MSAVLLAGVVSALLVVLSPSSAVACAQSYTAQRGDSWWLIAKKHGVSLSAVLRTNKAKPSSTILVGDVVCVAEVTKKADPQTQRVRYLPHEIIQIIREEWPDELEERAIQIARRESKLAPAAVGIPNKCCYGLFQIYYRWHKGWLPSVGVNQAEDLLDPRLNARAAYKIFQRNSGWGPWE